MFLEIDNNGMNIGWNWPRIEKSDEIKKRVNPPVGYKISGWVLVGWGSSLK
jgi:hypothetical protein